MNGNSGIQPTIELATNGNNGGFYPYPIYPMMSGGNNGGGFGFGDSSALWLIVLLALIWNGNGNGNGGFFGGGNSFDDGYAWLSNGQKEIMSNTNQGFDTLHLSNQLEGTRDGIYSLSNQLCNCCSDITGAINSTAYNAEIAAANRQMANMNQIYGLSTQLASASADNRLGIANLGSDIAREACATRTSDTQNTQTLLTAITGGIQSIKDEIFRDRLDEKDSKIAELNRQLQTADLRASQIQQTANIVDMTYARLRDCPIESTPIYGRTPIFTCPNNNGCGCNGNFATGQLF